jgi:hypothetical protein
MGWKTRAPGWTVGVWDEMTLAMMSAPSTAMVNIEIQMHHR